jgi:hypothetical protein
MELKHLPEEEAQKVLITLNDGRKVIALTAPFVSPNEKLEVVSIEVSTVCILPDGFRWSAPMCIYPGDD